MSDFFKHFSQMDYQFEDNINKNVINILSSVSLKKTKYRKSLVFQKYTTKDSDIAESLSYELYNTPMYYWVTLLINNIIDPYSEWVISNSTLIEYTNKKYKDGIRRKKIEGGYSTLINSIGINGIHHFKNINTNLICDDVDDLYYRNLWINDPLSIGKNIIPITNLEYEKELNFNKRQIAIVNPKYISAIEEDFINTLTGDIIDGDIDED